ncbi:MAG: hypothetical protein ACKOD2_11890, partial [Ilumatobacteraceae bacterium]
AWGLEWAARGGCELRLRAPVFQDDLVRCIPHAGDDGTVIVDAVVDDESNPRAVVRAWEIDSRVQAERTGDDLPMYEFTLDELHGPDYSMRAGDDLDLFMREGVVHPAVWPSLANGIFARELVRGSWIHTRSRITHLGLAYACATVQVHSRVVERFVRRGERAIVDMRIEADGTPVAAIEHEAIIDLTVQS